MDTQTVSKLQLNFTSMINATFEVRIHEHEFIDAHIEGMNPDELFKVQARREFIQALQLQKINAVEMMATGEAELEVNIIPFTKMDVGNGDSSIFASASLKFRTHVIDL